MDYITVGEAAKKWQISDRRVQLLCIENRIEGVKRFGRSFMIPAEAEKPADARKKNKGGVETEKQSFDVR